MPVSAFSHPMVTPFRVGCASDPVSLALSGGTSSRRLPLALSAARA